MLTRPVGLRALIAIASLLAPLLAGSVVYYSLRTTHPRIAHLANWMSFISFFTAAALLPWQWVQGDGRLVMAVLVGLGILGAEFGIRLIRATEPGIRQNAASSRAA